MHPTASVGLVAAFVVVVVGVVGVVIAAVSHVNAAWRLRAVLAAGVWLAANAAVGFSGVLLRFDARPPPFVVVLLLSVGVAVVVAVSDVGAALARLPLWLLVGFQAFRLPLELVMHEAAREGVMPAVMSFEGKNVDIVAGIAAIVVAISLQRGARPVWAGAWLTLASATLLNVVVIAVLASPLVRFFGDAELNIWIAYAPFVWLPTVLVASALSGQIILARALLQR